MTGFRGRAPLQRNRALRLSECPRGDPNLARIAEFRDRQEWHLIEPTLQGRSTRTPPTGATVAARGPTPGNRPLLDPPQGGGRRVDPRASVAAGGPCAPVGAPRVFWDRVPGVAPRSIPVAPVGGGARSGSRGCTRVWVERSTLPGRARKNRLPVPVSPPPGALHPDAPNGGRGDSPGANPISINLIN